MKSANSRRVLERRFDLPREVEGRPSARSTASVVSCARWSNRKDLCERSKLRMA